MADMSSNPWRPDLTDLRKKLEEAGMLEDGGFTNLTFHDTGLLSAALLDLVNIAAIALSEDSLEANRIAERSALSHQVRALVRALHAMRSGQQVAQLIPSGPAMGGQHKGKAFAERVYQHPARREAIGIAVEGYTVLHSRAGLKKRPAAKLVADAFAHVAEKLDLNWSGPAPRTIQEEWTTTIASGEGTPRFDAFLPLNQPATGEQVVALLINLLIGPLQVLAEHEQHNPPMKK